ncbi:MAG: hypothetical protein QGD94_11700, partial [Planctomycetia bacterium]|nr:hypothetical protein [Planctomycetia bacterium]
CQKEKYLAVRPKGAAIVCLSGSAIRRKWLEIICDLVSPTKRESYRGLPDWSRLCDAWTPELREAWLEADRPTAEYPLGRLLQDKAYPQVMWDTFVTPIGIERDLSFAPESDVKVCDTWLWSAEERRNYFIVVNADASDETVEGWPGSDEVQDGDKAVRMWRTIVDYETDIGLTADTLVKIADPQIILHPRFDKPVAKAKFVTPSVANIREVT